MEKFDPLPSLTERIAKDTVQAALKIHRIIGPGLLESIYEKCLVYELIECGYHVENQIRIPIVYEGLEFDASLRIDLLVEKQVLIEIKSVEKLLPVHAAQVLSYLRMTNIRLGLLINFNSVKIKDGIRRFINWFLRVLVTLR